MQLYLQEFAALPHMNHRARLEIYIQVKDDIQPKSKHFLLH